VTHRPNPPGPTPGRKRKSFDTHSMSVGHVVFQQLTVLPDLLTAICAETIHPSRYKQGSMFPAIAPLSGHSVFLLLLQLAVLLSVARLGAELSRRCGLPTVVGELAAGIALGPTIFGHYLPGAFDFLFPAAAQQFHLLEVVGTLGMVFLLLLTGLETDVRLLRNVGRAALVASAAGMVLPFIMGFVLGYVMPDSFIAQPEHRLLFSAFLATAMAISAMPVIAKILMDLDLTRRNIGLVIISAGVVDDTAGWLILSVIAGAASRGGAAAFATVGWTLVGLAVFLGAMAFLARPALKHLARAASRFRSPDADLVLIVVVTLVCAAITERIGVHAAFGAFVAGVVLRQVPHLEEGAVKRLESFALSVLAPVFFCVVGLKVDLFSLSGPSGLRMLGVVLGVACVGKLVGCTFGGLWSGMRFAEAFSIAIAMNARGAMGLIVATIGLSLGILNQQMFSIIVVVAVVTSFMAPIGLRLSMRFVRMTDDEARRISAEAIKSAFEPTRLRLLVPTAAGPNAAEAAQLAFRIAQKSQNAVALLNVETITGWRDRIAALVLRGRRSGGIAEHWEEVRTLAQRIPGLSEPRLRKTKSRDVAAAILAEAHKGADAILIGASQHSGAIGGRILEEVVAGAPCHVVIVRAGRDALSDSPRRNLFLPVDGSAASRVAAELAVRYCEATGARLTVAVQVERRRFAESLGAVDAGDPRGTSATGPMAIGRAPIEQTSAEELERISPLFGLSDVEPHLLHLDYDPMHSTVLDEAAKGGYDMVVLGAENRAIRHRVFFGYDNERLIKNSDLSMVIVVPNVGKLH
jgi:Kef-type K+ transport system membrane component KefB/nucleotide-binding universal stress UspA family protein